MSLHKILFSTALIGSAIVFTACSSSHRGPAPRKPMDTHGKSRFYVKGAEDGCATANGDYTKNHEAFNTNIEYHEGWFAGRRYCQI
jgi:hypothetical protein